MKETMDAGKMLNRSEMDKGEKTYAPLEWPCNDELKCRMEEAKKEEEKKNDSNIDNDNDKNIAAQLNIFDEDEPFDGAW